MYSRKLSSLLLGVSASSRLAGRGGSPVPPYPSPQPPASNNLKSTLSGRGGSPVPPYPPYPKPTDSGNLASRLGGRGGSPVPPYPHPIPPPPASAMSRQLVRG